MSTLAFPPVNEQEVFNLCRKQCGVITATEDYQYFALGCLFCSEKYLYFDAFMGHMQTRHTGSLGQNPAFDGGMFHSDIPGGALGHLADDDEDLTDTDPSLFEPQMVMVKEEVMDEVEKSFGQSSNNDSLNLEDLPNPGGMGHGYNSNCHVKQEVHDSSMSMDANVYNTNETYGGYEDFGGHEANIEEYDTSNLDDEETNYDDLVEESLLSDGGLVMHIKDRKMIQFLIEAYRRNTFLWDHRHPQFRDRGKRQQFLDWMLSEFKRRFNICLAKDAVTRKWDNLRTVYKRECNRMSLENTNVSTLWYFKELHFLNRLYGGNQKVSEAVVKETVYRRRYSALWNDVSTNKLLAMVKQHPCFYDKYHCDYRSKERRGEALQAMAAELQKIIDVTTIQISKRISQLRFDYSKQKSERLQCEQTNKVFAPSYTYYDQMFFMDSDIGPFKCEFCPMIMQTMREMEVHVLTHQTSIAGHSCSVCHMTFFDVDQYNRHKQTHAASSSSSSAAASALSSHQTPPKYQCDLCSANFRDKSNYDEHVRRHNDELLLPSLIDTPLPTVTTSGSNSSGSSNSLNMDAPYTCNVCGKGFSSRAFLNSHKAIHDRNFRCTYPQCYMTFTARHTLIEHMRQHSTGEEYECNVCGKGFKSPKNLQNHKQIHDAVKRYVCKICGSAFAQAAGLYLHKRRHNRANSRLDQGYQ